MSVSSDYFPSVKLFNFARIFVYDACNLFCVAAYENESVSV